MTLQDWKNKNKYARHYAHFDNKVNLARVWRYISNPKKVKQHSFYPFIHYTDKFRRYNKKDKLHHKEREIYYSAHIDRYIFQYYSYKLNTLYNKRVKKDKINDVAIAYRTDLHKSNINFAKEAIDFIREKQECYIFVGDFTDFFDSLDHRYLKKKICQLLKVKSLPDDYYAIYKNITSYSWWELESILELNGLEMNKNSRRKLNKKDKALSLENFRSNKKDNISRNNKSFGIPQGSAISAILSNVYMLDFDKLMNNYVKGKKGLYMRYSDDFIIILPKTNNMSYKDQKRYIYEIIESVPGLILKAKKTQSFKYNNKTLVNLGCGKDIMDYLGFSFDGNMVTIRDKTISKYYYRMYRKADTIVKSRGMTKNKNKISHENLYQQYSIKGANRGKGNFITYVQRAEKIFGKDEDVGRVLRTHMGKIKKRLHV